MSWIFGGGGDGDDDDDGYDDYDDDNNDYDDNDKTRVIADFDPKPLQEGVKALREIDKNSNAKDVLKMVIETEKRKTAEAKLREQQMIQSNLQYREQAMKKEFDQRAEQKRLEQQQWEERMKREEQMKRQAEERQRQEKERQQQAWLKKQEEQNNRNLQRQLENNKKIEEEKRRTLDYQAKLDQDTAKIRAKAETEGKILYERENEDLHLRSQREKLSEDRKTRLEIRSKELEYHNKWFENITEIFTDRDKLTLLSKFAIGTFVGIYGAKTSIRLFGNQLEKRIGRPSLIRETSRTSFKDFIPNRNWLNIFNRGNKNDIDDLKGIILDKSLTNKMKFITRGTRNTKKNNAPFRHLCIYGPPGTGKTLFARSLARDSGLHYAVMTGGDFSQLGNNAVQELHKVFDWAESSKKGTILFIDEADAFLRKGREGDIMSENMRNALSAFLYRTGTETKDFMVCLATNVPEALDKAVIDRIDDIVEFPLPGKNERLEMLKYYFKVFITQEEEPTYSQKHMTGSFLNTKQMTKINCQGFDDDTDIFNRLAEKTQGFSGRQIAKYLIQVQATIFQSADDIELNPFLMEQILETFLKSKAFGHE